MNNARLIVSPVGSSLLLQESDGYQGTHFEPKPQGLVVNREENLRDRSVPSDLSGTNERFRSVGMPR